VSSPAEHGDRAAFLGRIRARQGPPPAIGPHPPPPPPEVVPEVGYRALDGVGPGDAVGLAAAFVEAARRAAAVVHEGDLAGAVAEIVERHGVGAAVATTEPEVDTVRALLVGLGVDVVTYGPGAGPSADLGVTSALLGVAATGSVVLDAGPGAGRGASLLPAVHLCVLPAERLVATPSDVFRRGPRPLPSNRVVITGPSRTGDIEQIITMGAHGPLAVHIVLT
jgi:L-lactate dehydrogenase complex protein LldG